MKTTRNFLSATTMATLLLSPTLLVGCDAAAGAGRDISRAGQAITQSANQTRGY